jgi:hypothetical protein
LLTGLFQFNYMKPKLRYCLNVPVVKRSLQEILPPKTYVEFVAGNHDAIDSWLRSPDSRKILGHQDLRSFLLDKGMLYETMIPAIYTGE